MTCKFSEEYFDYEKGKEITYTCAEDVVDDEYCIFHHPKYWKKNPKKVSAELRNRVMRHSIKPLYFIGYNIPDINFSGLNIRVPVYFTYANFYGQANFKQTIFSSSVDFSLAKFFNDAVFTKVEFQMNAYFSFVIIHSETDFRLAVFHKLLDFRDAEFKEKANFWASRYLGDADFSSSEFHDEADFRLATFNKKAIFDHTTFNFARFYGAKFIGSIFFRYARIKKSDFRHATFFGKKYFNGTTILEKIE